MSVAFNFERSISGSVTRVECGFTIEDVCPEATVQASAAAPTPLRMLYLPP